MLSIVNSPDINDKVHDVVKNNGVVFFIDYWGRKKFVGGDYCIAVGLDAMMWSHKGVTLIEKDVGKSVKLIQDFYTELRSAKKKTKGVKESLADCQRYLDTVGKNHKYSYL